MRPFSHDLQAATREFGSCIILQKRSRVISCRYASGEKQILRRVSRTRINQPMSNNKPTKAEIKAQLLRVKALEIELHEDCDTNAKHVCVYRALDEATRKLREMQAA